MGGSSGDIEDEEGLLKLW